MFKSIKDQTAIVTGGSKGIGRGIAKVFGRQGANIVIAARGAEAAQNVVDEIKSDGGTASYFNCDVTKFDDLKALISYAESTYGGVNILCSNAGIFPQVNMIDMQPEEWDHVMSTNLKSTFLSVKAAIPAMEKIGKGRIIVTSSITGPVTGFPGWSHYGASKSGQLGFIKTAAIELAKYGITINAVMPGNIVTEGLENLGQHYLDKMASSIPLKRLGNVEDVGYAALFFATEEASYITGQQIVIDGGQILPESLEALESA